MTTRPEISRKALSLSVAFALTLSMVPIISPTQVRAEESDAVELIKTMEYDSTNPDSNVKVQQDLLKAINEDDETKTKNPDGSDRFPITEEGGFVDYGKIMAKFFESHPEFADEASYDVSVESVRWDEYTEVELLESDIVSTDAASAETVLEIEQPDESDRYLLTATDNVDQAEMIASVPFKVDSGKFTCTYSVIELEGESDSAVEVDLDSGIDPSNQPKAGRASANAESNIKTLTESDIELDLSDKFNEFYRPSYEIALNNVQESDKAKLESLRFDNEEFTYYVENEAKKVDGIKGTYNVECVRDPDIDESESSFLDDSFDIQNGSIEVRTMPKHMNDESITLFFSYGDDNAQLFENGLTLTVADVGKNPITPTIPDQPFRLKDDQESKVVAAAIASANEEVGKIKADDIGDGVLAPIQSNDFSYIDTDTAQVPAQDFTASLKVSLRDDLADRYMIVDSDGNEINEIFFNVGKVEDEQLPSGFVLSDGANADKWVNKDVTAKYERHTLAVEYNKTYEDSLALNTAEGKYEDQTCYAKDEDGVITRVTGIAYNLDKTAPVIQSFAIENKSEGTEDPSGIFLFTKPIDVKIAVSEPQGQLAEPSVQPENSYKGSGWSAKVSGLVADGASVTYNDSISGQEKAIKAFTVGDDGNSGLFDFQIDGDQNVKTDSFKATVKDTAGNVMNADTADAMKVPADILELLEDGAPPKLTVTFDNDDARNGSYYNSNRTATITITEPYFNFIQDNDPNQIVVNISENGETRTFKAADFKNVGNNVYQQSYTFSNNSSYRITAQVTDLLGRASERYDSEFTIDKIAPSISVDFDNNSSQGNYFNAARTATVTIFEHNFSDALVNVIPATNAGNDGNSTPASVDSWAHDGDTHTLRVNFPGQGVYSMTINGSDLAMNALSDYSCPEFVIDTDKPSIEISIGGDADGSRRAYQGDCSISVTVHDANVNPASEVSIEAISWNNSSNPYLESRSTSDTELSITCANPEAIPESDGVYRVTVNASDMAGNSDAKTVEWSVNRFGSTYVLHEDTQDMVDRKYINSDQLHDVMVTEINPSGLQEDAVSVSMTCGTQNQTLERDKHYSFAATTDNDWPAYSYVIPRDNFSSDGTYQITLHSTDSAGNSSMNTMDSTNRERTHSADVLFSVDNTAPIVSFSGFEKSEIPDTEHPVMLSIVDNIALDHAKVMSNGRVIKELDREELQSEEHEVIIDESNDSQVITVEAYDMAGNMTPQNSSPILVTSNAFILWLHNPVFVVSTILAIAAVAGGIVLFARRRGVNRK